MAELDGTVTKEAAKGTVTGAASGAAIGAGISAATAATAAGVAGTIGSGVAAGAAGGSSVGPWGTVIGALVGLIAGIAKGSVQHAQARKSVDAQNRITAATNAYNEETANMNLNRENANLLQTKKDLAFNNRLAGTKMGMQKDLLLKAQNRQDAQIKNDLLASSRTGMTERIQRLDQNLLRVGR